jgi:ankyrin repeat protein
LNKNIGNNVNRIRDAIEEGSYSAYLDMVDELGSIDVINKYSVLLMRGAVFCRNGDLVKILISDGVDVDVRDEDGKTPLFSAAKSGTSEMCELLLNNFANINATDNNGTTALFEAIKYGNKDSLSYLLAHGADIYVKDNQRRTPLHCAARYREDMCLPLIGLGLNIEAKDRKGKTPSLTSIQYRNMDATLALIACGACTNILSEPDPEIHQSEYDLEIRALLELTPVEAATKLSSIALVLNALDSDKNPHQLKESVVKALNLADKERKTVISGILSAWISKQTAQATLGAILLEVE